MSAIMTPCPLLRSDHQSFDASGMSNSVSRLSSSGLSGQIATRINQLQRIYQPHGPDPASDASHGRDISRTGYERQQGNIFAGPTPRKSGPEEQPETDGTPSYLGPDIARKSHKQEHATASKPARWEKSAGLHAQLQPTGIGYGANEAMWAVPVKDRLYEPGRRRKYDKNGILIPFDANNIDPKVSSSVQQAPTKHEPLVIVGSDVSDPNIPLLSDLVSTIEASGRELPLIIDSGIADRRLSPFSDMSKHPSLSTPTRSQLLDQREAPLEDMQTALPQRALSFRGERIPDNHFSSSQQSMPCETPLSTKRRNVREMYDYYGIKRPVELSSDYETRGGARPIRVQKNCHVCGWINGPHDKCWKCMHHFCGQCDAISPEVFYQNEENFAQEDSFPLQYPLIRYPEPSSAPPGRTCAAMPRSLGRHSPKPEVLRQEERRQTMQSSANSLRSEHRSRRVHSSNTEKFQPQRPGTLVPATPRLIFSTSQPLPVYLKDVPRRSPLIEKSQKISPATWNPCESPGCRATHEGYQPYRHSSSCNRKKQRFRKESDSGYNAGASEAEVFMPQPQGKGPSAACIGTESGSASYKFSHESVRGDRLGKPISSGYEPVPKVPLYTIRHAERKISTLSPIPVAQSMESEQQPALSPQGISDLPTPYTEKAKHRSFFSATNQSPVEAGFSRDQNAASIGMMDKQQGSLQPTNPSTSCSIDTGRSPSTPASRSLSAIFERDTLPFLGRKYQQQQYELERLTKLSDDYIAEISQPPADHQYVPIIETRQSAEEKEEKGAEKKEPSERTGPWPLNLSERNVFPTMVKLSYHDNPSTPLQQDVLGNGKTEMMSVQENVTDVTEIQAIEIVSSRTVGYNAQLDPLTAKFSTQDPNSFPTGTATAAAKKMQDSMGRDWDVERLARPLSPLDHAFAGCESSLKMTQIRLSEKEVEGSGEVTGSKNMQTAGRPGCSCRCCACNCKILGATLVIHLERKEDLVVKVDLKL